MAMSPEQWQEIESCFEHLLDLPASERAPWLDRHCDDPVVRSEVLQLLAAADRDEGFLEAPAAELASGLIREASHADGLPAERVGPYRLVREIGRGGMGAVFLAERADGHFEQRVALKLLGRRFPSDALRQRFMAERQILAGLGHPGIARLLDGGMAEDGSPYFALEYVDGRPIDRFCAEEGLSLRQRLRLFLQTCAAVSYAHRSLVVHRDLKPSNILVETDASGEPRVRLLDFGIAKLLTGEPEAEGGPATVTGIRLMTPEYASPEQVNGRAVTTASDVYQLGILLHELLTGRRLHDFSGSSLTEIARIVGREEVPRPSQTAEKAVSGDRARERRARRLRGDLDAIVLRAVRKEPEARYDSVDRLADDIERYLDGRPVRAHEGSVTYRLGKAVRRHRASVAVAAAFVVALIAYAASVTALQQRTQRERDRATRYAEFLTELFASPDPLTETPGDRDITVLEFLDQAVERVHQDLATDLPMQASLLHTIADVFENLGYSERAGVLYEELIDSYRRIEGPVSPEIVDVMGDLAWIVSDAAASDSLFRAGLELARELDGGDGPETGQLLVQYGSSLANQGLLDEAQELLERAVQILNGAGEAFEEERAGALYFLGQLYREVGRLSQADSVLRIAYDFRTAFSGPQHPRTAVVMTELGGVAEDMGDLEQAAYWKGESLSIFDATVGAEHRYTLAARNNLAVLLQKMGRFEESEALHREVLALRARVFGPDDARTVGSVQNLGVILVAQGRLDEAEAMFEDVRGRYARSLSPDDHLHAFPLLSLWEVRMKKGDYAGAEAFVRQAWIHLRRALPEGHPFTLIAESRLGEAVARQGRFEEAEPLLVGSLEAMRKLDGYYDRQENAQRRVTELYAAWGRTPDPH